MYNIGFKRLFHHSPRLLETIALCPGQGNVGPNLFKLIQYEIKHSPDAGILDTIESVRPVIDDPRILSFFDPEKSPFMIKDHSNMELLKSTSFIQPLILLTTFLNYRLIEKYSDWDVRKADYLLGHSLGELSSFVIQDVLTLESGLKIATSRGKLMESAISTGSGKNKKWGMCAILFNPVDYDICLKMCQNTLKLNVATINGFNQIVVSGKISELKEKLAEMDDLRQYYVKHNCWKGPLRKVWLKTEVPVHHPIFKSIENELNDIIMDEFAKCGSKELKVPIVSNYDGSIISLSSERALSKFVKLTSSTVKFTDCLASIHNLRQINPEMQFNFVNISEVTNGLVKRYFKDINENVNNYDLVNETLNSLQ